MWRAACIWMCLAGCGTTNEDEDEDDGSCEVAGQVYADGERVPSEDDCNSCDCEGGEVWCTTQLCSTADTAT